METFWSKYVFSTDHKMIAMQYMFTGMFMALIGGFFAYTFNMQMAFPGDGRAALGRHRHARAVQPLITNHGAIMIFWVAMPVLIAAFGNFLIPLMIGCDDMVFPKINRLSYQIFLLSVVVLLASFFVETAGSRAPGRSTRRCRRSTSTASRRSARRCSCWRSRSSSSRSCSAASTSSPPR